VGNSGVRARMVKAGMLPSWWLYSQTQVDSGVRARMVKAGMLPRLVALLPDPGR
jgi:hypothetical protein